MKILIACEISGIVRDAFIAKGHDAISCDIFPTERPGPHIQCKVQPLLKQQWDMIIAFPPCTYLTTAGIMWNERYPWRIKETQKALSLIRQILRANSDKICLENPVGIISSKICKPTQVIHPWQHGHAKSKRTCLWLKNLPNLIPTNIVTPMGSFVQNEPGGRNQARNRSYTFPGIAQAMADQWG